MCTALITLPEYYNPDKRGRRKRVEESKFRRTAEELSLHFDAGGSILRPPKSGVSRGFWWDKGVLYEDDNVVLEIDIDDTRENRAWIEQYVREVCLQRFRQVAMYVRFVGPIETLVVRREVVQGEGR